MAEIVNVYVFLGVLVTLLLVLVLVLLPQPIVTIIPETIMPTSSQPSNFFQSLRVVDSPAPISASAGSGSHNA
jgi:hypothetical protein